VVHLVLEDLGDNQKEDQTVVQVGLILAQEDQVVVQEDQLVVQEDQLVAQEDLLVVQEDLTAAWEDQWVDWEVLNQPFLHIHSRELLILL